MSDTAPLQPLTDNDWQALKGTTSDKVGGPRGYQGSEANARAPWKCPACAALNEGLLGEGCSSCGSGGGAKHVGIDPIVRKGDRYTPDVPGYRVSFRPPVIVDVQQAFTQWILGAGAAVGPLDAFTAGWTARERVPIMAEPDAPVVIEPIAVDAAPSVDPPLLGTARTRTLLAALIVFKEQVLINQPEELISGEWVGLAELDQMIAELREAQTDHD